MAMTLGAQTVQRLPQFGLLHHPKIYLVTLFFDKNIHCRSTKPMKRSFHHAAYANLGRLHPHRLHLRQHANHVEAAANEGSINLTWLV
jgi:hypothetical protein